MRKLKKYKQTRFMAKGSHYDKEAADYAVAFIESLCHTKGKWAGKKFELIDWQEQIVRDLFGTIKENGYRQFNQAYIEIPKKQGKSELAAAVALLLTCGYRPEQGCDLFEEGMRRYCKHSRLRFLGSHAERHLGYDVPFMDAEKEARTRAFARELRDAVQ